MAAWTPLFAPSDKSYGRVWSLIEHWLATLFHRSFRANAAAVVEPPRHQLRLLLEYIRMSGNLTVVPDGVSVLDASGGLPGAKFEHAGLHGGLCEMVWISNHILELSMPAEVTRYVADPCSAFDDMLVSRLRERPWTASLDGANGLTGRCWCSILRTCARHTAGRWRKFSISSCGRNGQVVARAALRQQVGAPSANCLPSQFRDT
jgi:hypothetical protein